MPVELRRLLGTYDFLRNALSDHRHRLAPEQSNEFERSLDETFLEILNYPSEDLRVTLVQTRFLMTQLVAMSKDKDTSGELRKICEQHLNRLAEQALPKPQETFEPMLTEYRYLDSLTDRVAVFDKDYRYRFTNKANADFHGEPAVNFLDRPNWYITGERFFEAVNRPRFDQCLAGQSLSFITAHPSGDASKLYLVTIDPIRNASGTIETIVGKARDISNLPVPGDLVIPFDRNS